MYVLRNAKVNQLTQILTLILLSIVISFSIQQDRVITTLYTSSNKVGIPLLSLRQKLSDNPHYYNITKVKFENFVEKAFHPHNTPLPTEAGKVSNIISATILTSGAVNYLTKSLFTSSRIGVLAFFIAETAILIFAILIAFKTILDNKYKINPLILLLFGLLMTLFFDPFLTGSSFNLSWIRYPLLNKGGLSELFRLAHPKWDWVFAMVYLSLMIKFFRSNSKVIYSLILILSLLSGLFSVSITATFGLTIGMVFIYEIYKNKRINNNLLVVLLLLSFSFIFSYYQAHIFLSTEKGKYTSVGKFMGIHLAWHFLKFLLLIAFINHVIKDKSKPLLISLTIACCFLGLITNCFYPSEIWIRGCGILIFLFIATLLYAYLFNFITYISNLFMINKKFRFSSHDLKDILFISLFFSFFTETIFPLTDRFVKGPLYVCITFIVISLTFYLAYHYTPPKKISASPTRAKVYLNLFLIGLINLIFFCLYIYLKPNLSNQYGFINKDEWLALDWLNKHAKRGTVILSSNQEDMSYIPFYTKATSFIPLYSVSSLSLEETIMRYFFVTDLFHTTNKYLKLIQNYNSIYADSIYIQKHCQPTLSFDNFQVFNFFSELVYYPDNTRFKEIFSNKATHEKFMRLITNLHLEAKTKVFKYDLILADKNHVNIHLLSNKKVIYENPRFVVLK